MVLNKIDTSEKKIGSFISAIITLVFSCVLMFVCLRLGQTIHDQTGLARLSMVVTIPILIILHVLWFGLSIGGGVSAVFGIFSSVKGIKIVSILLLLVAIAFFGVQIYTLTLVL